MHIDNINTVSPWSQVANALSKDSEYAWSVQCNIAMPIMDELKCTHKEANVTAAKLMLHLWKYDITTHPAYIRIVNN